MTKTEIATFQNAAGHTLSASIDLPVGHRRAVALFAHCFSCGKDLRSIRRLTSRLAAEGIAVARFDFTGLGQSEGSFSDTNFSSNVADLVAAADWLRQNYAAPSLLIGHSLGGAAVIKAASQIPELRGIATIGAPSDPSHVTHLLANDIPTIEREGEATVTIAGRQFQVQRQFLDDIASSSLDESLRELDLPLLIMHAPGDTIVGIENADQLFAAARHPKSFVALDGADHLLSDPASAEEAAAVLAAWAERHLPDRLAPSDDVIHAAAEGEVLVVERGTGAFAQTIRVADRHTLLADEPPGIGDDTGPAPYDFLLAGLGSCTSMTLRMYADRKGYPLEGVSVAVTHEKIHAKDCAECDSTTGKVDHISRRITLEGPLDETQRADLIRIADRCPVHRTLTGEIRIT